MPPNRHLPGSGSPPGSPGGPPGEDGSQASLAGTADIADIAELARALQAGCVLCALTESFAGLIALATCGAAVARLLAAKGARNLAKGMPLLAADLAQVQQAAALPAWAARVAAAYWPGPVTLALPSGHAWPPGVAAADGSIGVRVPAHGPLRALARAAGGCLTATSANVSGQPPVRDLAAVRLASWRGLRPVRWAAGAPQRLNLLPSTVVAAGPDGRPRVVRAGEVATALLEQLLAPSELLG